MRAIAVTQAGGLPVLTDLATPEPGPGEVLVRVSASSLNGVDLYMARLAAQGDTFPFGLGKDFAGTVQATGSGVTRFGAGDRVFGWLAKPGVDGTFAEYVTVPEASGIARIPAGLDAGPAGALGLAGTAALMSVDAVSPQPGQTVLIVGATGGVGALAVQLAARGGADVIATAQSPDEVEFVRSLGARLTVDYSTDIIDSVRYERPKGVECVIHLAGDGAALADLLVAGGRIASTLGFGPDRLGDREAVAVAIMATPDPSLLERLADEAAAGRLLVPILRTYSLAEVPQGLADFAAGTLGKLAVAID